MQAPFQKKPELFDPQCEHKDTIIKVRSLGEYVEYEKRPPI